MSKKQVRVISMDVRITRLFKKYIVKRPNGNCQVLFALTELDDLVDEIVSLKFLLPSLPTKLNKSNGTKRK